MLLGTIGNGEYVGGKYRAAPRSNNADGLLEVCLIKPLPRHRLLGLMSLYEKGGHLEDSRLGDRLIYRRAKNLRISPQGSMIILLDGELQPIEDVSISVMPGALLFAVPAGAGLGEDGVKA